VSDTGQGISPEFLPHVFDRFRQADSSRTRNYGGLGLGLAIVRHLVDLHGGNVRAESPGAGQGTTLTISLPLMTAPAGESKYSGQQQVPSSDWSGTSFTDSPALDGLRVLVVDDDADTLRVLNVMLEQCGAEVRIAGSVPEAFHTLEEWRPDVLVSDISMPDEDGYDLIRMRASAARRARRGSDCRGADGIRENRESRAVPFGRLPDACAEAGRANRVSNRSGEPRRAHGEGVNGKCYRLLFGKRTKK
jgi:hypothetical protein